MKKAHRPDDRAGAGDHIGHLLDSLSVTQRVSHRLAFGDAADTALHDGDPLFNLLRSAFLSCVVCGLDLGQKSPVIFKLACLKFLRRRRAGQPFPPFSQWTRIRPFAEVGYLVFQSQIFRFLIYFPLGLTLECYTVKFSFDLILPHLPRPPSAKWTQVFPSATFPYSPFPSPISRDGTLTKLPSLSAAPNATRPHKRP